MASLRIHLFGSPRFSVDDRAATLASAKAIALLAYLACNRAPQPRERLMDLLWPDSLAEAGRKNLRNTLWTIRKTPGDDALSTSSDRLTVSKGVWVDAREF